MKDLGFWRKWRAEKQDSVEWWENHTAEIAREFERAIIRLHEQRAGLAEIDAQIVELRQAEVLSDGE